MATPADSRDKTTAPTRVEETTQDFNSPFYHFCVDFIESYKKQHPEDKRLADVNVNAPNWWETVPAEFDKAAEEEWNKTTDADKTPYVTRSEKIRQKEEVLASYAFALFRNEYIRIYKKIHPKDKSFAGLSVSPGGWWSGCPEHVGEAAAKAWQAKKDESREKYFSLANKVLKEDK